MIRLIAVEARRALSRRLVRALILIALGIIAFAAVRIYTAVDPVADSLVRRRGDDVNAAYLVDLWRSREGIGILSITTVFLAIGGLIGGSSVMGAEWRAGTITPLLTWEPRRIRVALVKIGVAAALAALIHIGLQAVFSLSLMPTVMGKGTTAGADAEWFRGVVGVVLRGAALTGMAAALGASIALIGRNTAATLGVAFVYVMIVEQILRAWRPGLRPWLLAENIGVFFSARPLRDQFVIIDRSTLQAGLTLLLYVAVLVAIGTALFRRRDIAGA